MKKTIAFMLAFSMIFLCACSDNKTETTTESTTEGVSIDLEALASQNDATKPDKQQNSYVFEPGKYKVATKDDPLGLRLEPNTDSDRIIYVPKGHQVEVLAVWEDWGYVVYEKTGGWLSMNYLELISGSSDNKKPETTAKAE